MTANLNALCGVIGKRDADAVRRMAAVLSHRSAGATDLVEGDDFTLIAGGASSESRCLVDGMVRDDSGRNLTPAEFAACCTELGEPHKLTAHGAFAAVVEVGRAWWLMRDRMGSKPLYYAEGSGFLVFASELKAILASGLIPKHIDLASVDRYLTLRCVPGTDSIMQGIKRVQPGHVVVYADGKVTQTAFARFDLEPAKISRQDAAHTLQELLKRSVGRCQADTLLWAAGIDCAAIAAFQEKPRGLFVELKSWQTEAWRARESARLMDVNLEVRPAKRISESMIEDAAYHLDEPVADASVLPLWMIAEQAGRNSGPVLTGHGADDILGGYTRFNFLSQAGDVRRMVPVTFLSGILPALPPNAFLRRGGRFLTNIKNNLEAYLSLVAVFDQSERDDLYTDAMKSAIFEKGGSAAVIRPHFAEADMTRSLLSLDLNVVIPGILLTECDRLMAAHGVSAELPFLDDALVDFAVRLPSSIKYGVPSKPVLRQAMKGLLPGRIRLRARRSFQVPQSGTAFRTIELAARSIVSQERVEASGLFKWPYVSKVLSSATHNVYRRRQFWALLMFFAWYRRFMEV